MTRLELQFHLILEDLGSSNNPSAESSSTPGRRGEFARLELPLGICYLVAPVGKRPALASQPPAPPGWFWALESVFGPRQPQLVMVSPANHRPRVNGRPAPRFAVLGVKDQVQLDDAHVLHVTLFNAPVIGTPPPEAVGRECPICRTPFAADSTVYLCSVCRTPLHCEGEGQLECALVGSECPVCNSPVVLEQGYTYVPEVADG